MGCSPPWGRERGLGPSRREARCWMRTGGPGPKALGIAPAICGGSNGFVAAGCHCVSRAILSTGRFASQETLMVPLSVLDLVHIVQGSAPRQALHNSLDLARHVERLGYHRFWVAEHHNMPGI